MDVMFVQGFLDPLSVVKISSHMSFLEVAIVSLLIDLMLVSFEFSVVRFNVGLLYNYA